MNQWLQTLVVTNRGTGQGTGRAIVMSGTNTTVRAVPTITRTMTRGAVAVATTTNEDEGYTISFAIKIRSLLGTVPAGADSPPSPICS